MSVKLKEIGVVVEKRVIENICCCDCIPCKTDTCDRCELPTSHGGMNSLCAEGDNGDWAMPFNEAIDQFGEISIGFNRERLARSIHEYWRLQCLETGTIKCSWEDLHDAGREGYLNEADAIIAEEKSILEIHK